MSAWGATWSGDAARGPHALGGRCGVGSLPSAAGQVRGVLLLVAEQVAGLAVQDLAEGGQGGEADGPGAAVLED